MRATSRGWPNPFLGPPERDFLVGERRCPRRGPKKKKQRDWLRVGSGGSRDSVGVTCPVRVQIIQKGTKIEENLNLYNNQYNDLLKITNL